jgi:hypothetical protein
VSNEAGSVSSLCLLFSTHCGCAGEGVKCGIMRGWREDDRVHTTNPLRQPTLQPPRARIPGNDEGNTPDVCLILNFLIHVHRDRQPDNACKVSIRAPEDMQLALRAGRAARAREAIQAINSLQPAGALQFTDSATRP